MFYISMVDIEKTTKFFILLPHKKTKPTYEQLHMALVLHFWKSLLALEKEIKGKRQLLYKANMVGAPMFGEKMVTNIYKIMMTRGILCTAGACIQDPVCP